MSLHCIYVFYVTMRRHMDGADRHMAEKGDLMPVSLADIGL